MDAQRESAENFIKSQKSEGWQVLPIRYDDGGFTGANIDRPALQKLIADIKDGQIDCVVVYKVDRLSRSLLDFVQLLELFEKHNVAFVSVTQAFNTNTSMGRLTLNILLSFAQFEREIISERTRDKMAAARKKGKWIGGRPILGYDLDRDNRSLIINPKEAQLVREIFELYIKEKSLLSVAKILNKGGILTKKYVTKAGKTFGGIPFKNTQVRFIIKNVLYTGKVNYKGELYSGLHEAIIDENTFNKAQEILAENRIERKPSKNEKVTGLLNNILHCKACNTIMCHTYTSKGNIKYRYYVCMHAQKHGSETCPTRSVSAPAIEDSVVECLRKIAIDSERQKETVESLNKQLNEEIKSLVAQQDALSSQIQEITGVPIRPSSWFVQWAGLMALRFAGAQVVMSAS
ncbi:MAG: recombinase family protein [Candidatus Omnitrophica bacterium]|nr:recombinase family protein [Candidatus Omnitrophota bacterium]